MSLDRGAIDRPDLARTTLSVLFIGALIVGSLWILAPFLAAFVWAAMIVVATWSMMLRVQRAFGGRRSPAVIVMTLGLLAILIVPLAVAIETIFAQAGNIAALVARLPTMVLPPAPEWLGRLPLGGAQAQAAWNDLASAGMADLMTQAQPYLREAATWLVHHAGSFAGVLLHFVLVAILSAVLYAQGESWGAWVRGFGRRLADAQGERMVVLAGGAIRGVAMGVVVTAVVQSVLGGIGLAIAGVPFAGVLTAVMFALCIAQLGPLLVLLGATAWAYYNLGAGWGTFMLVWAVVVGLLDNVLRPVLIRRGADLPLMLIFAGVIGGLIAFGIIGIFVGPVLLAVAYTLLDDWVSHAPPSQAASPPTLEHRQT
jgi:predicted PurR-regulated permease PerM